jgi:hypothetical protein
LLGENYGLAAGLIAPEDVEDVRVELPLVEFDQGEVQLRRLRRGIKKS